MGIVAFGIALSIQEKELEVVQRLSSVLGQNFPVEKLTSIGSRYNAFFLLKRLSTGRGSKRFNN